MGGAIEQKQVAQQEAERQTYIVAKAEQEKKASVIRAEGEAAAPRSFRGRSRSAARASLKSDASTPRRRSRSRCRARAASRTCRRAGRTVGPIYCSGCRTAERRRRGGPREFC